MKRKVLVKFWLLILLLAAWAASGIPDNVSLKRRFFKYFFLSIFEARFLDVTKPTKPNQTLNPQPTNQPTYHSIASASLQDDALYFFSYLSQHCLRVLAGRCPLITLFFEIFQTLSYKSEFLRGTSAHHYKFFGKVWDHNIAPCGLGGW